MLYVSGDCLVAILGCIDRLKGISVCGAFLCEEIIDKSRGTVSVKGDLSMGEGL